MSRSKFEVWIMVAILASMVACKDSVESHYASAASAAQAGMFEHGWLPASITKGEVGERGLQTLRGDDYFVAVDPHNGNGYFWETEKQYPRAEPITR